ncbi:hypothetical protein Lal_00048646 [Lupinus albus]|uniref:E3 ubiquitin protein ligase n=1 Tax=Lupinus albus TaxID=3870 RepID=A0A6A4P9S1_LUPAL|nr:putative aminoacyltransferase, E1 ubiquitin-activating enzyme [Lupinus albus]KAF1864081.1 hypothetical protein Lal_00048646 [Lupinus albus]
MENSDDNEPEQKRPHRTPRNSTNNKNVDAGVVEVHKHLVQQTNTQKHNLQDLEEKIKNLKERQKAYDDLLIAVNQCWIQLVNDLVLLGIQAGRGLDALRTLVNPDNPQGSLPLCPVEDIFLCNLIQKDCVEGSCNDEIVNYVEEALSLRQSSTLELLKLLQDTIDAQREKIGSIAQVLHGDLSSEDLIIQMSKVDDMMNEDAYNLREVIDALNAMHKEYAAGIQNYISGNLQDQADIKHLTGELDESLTELEECRRKLVNLKMQKDSAAGMRSHNSNAVNGNLSPEKPVERTTSSRELKESIEESKIVVAGRLSELQDAREDNQILTKQLQDLQNELNDDKYVHSSRIYSLANDQLQHWNTELERYKMLTESLKAGSVHVTKWEKELNLKLESADTARRTRDNSDYKIEELELQLQKCTIEKNDLEMKMEEAIQDTGRKDIKSEFHVMSSALSNEMGMMDAQLKRWKDTAQEAVFVREKVNHFRAYLSAKTSELTSLVNRSAEQNLEIKSLKALIEKLERDNMELGLICDMHGDENYEKSTIAEIRESERRARSQAEGLKNALDEHSLVLRVKAANEVEAACEQRLSAAEAELEDLKAQLDASERDVLELSEAIRVKDTEAETYMSEIETIGQAYEDMQTQNQHLLQMVAERDDYNIKLVSESVKTKQAHSTLLSEKQALAKQLQQINASLENSKTRIVHSEEQMKALLSEAMKSTQEEKHLALTLEFAKWELADAEKELKFLKSNVSSSEKEYNQVQKDVEAMEMELESERSSRKKLEDELMEMNRQIAELSSETGEEAVQKLEDELKVCKNMIKCTVCYDRLKEVVIVKCCHMFCSQCIQRNLELRHRKCPACGTAFGQSDVRLVKI